MSCLREEVLIEPCIKEIDEYSLISSEDVIKVSGTIYCEGNFKYKTPSLTSILRTKVPNGLVEVTLNSHFCVHLL